MVRRPRAAVLSQCNRSGFGLAARALFLLAAVRAAAAACTVTAQLGCFRDAGEHASKSERTLRTRVEDSASLEECAANCALHGFGDDGALRGVEYGTQCYCGHRLQACPAPGPMSVACQRPFPRAQSQLARFSPRFPARALSPARLSSWGARTSVRVVVVSI